jgi:hypothetical protein
MEGILSGLAGLSATIFSPTKMVYIAYIVLVALKLMPVPSLCLFLFLSAIFWVLEIMHNDYLRCILNRCGKCPGTHP